LDAFLEEVKQRILDMMATAGIQIVHIEGESSGCFRFIKKLRRQHHIIDQVYDLVAMRIITESVRIVRRAGVDSHRLETDSRAL
jgi:(p)ppGpp synthase/HD superfamily hydrolase